LVKYLNQAVDKVRRQEVKKQHELKQTRYLWGQTYFIGSNTLCKQFLQPKKEELNIFYTS